MKTKFKKLKTVTVEELRTINQNTIKAKFNRILDIDELVKEGILSDEMDFAYPVQLGLYHKNEDGSMAIRVYINSNDGPNSLIMDMTVEDYDKLFKMRFKVVA
ncbi:hypothetical protein ACNQGP_05005 [Flavobacterium sp. GT2N3]|uniref:hypothetical protein n=1 Tax=unclassified Flavobacterium TaxID=196869 RepID=UPI003AAC10A2